MMLNKLAEWRSDVLFKAHTDGVDVDLKVTALYSPAIQGYIVFATIDGKGEIFVSSQRQERRVFKTLDALHRAMKSVGIPWFEVVG